MPATHAAIQSLFLDGPAGRLEALLNAGADDATHAGLVCHPHPLFGGTMHNKVVFHAMKAMHAYGFRCCASTSAARDSARERTTKGGASRRMSVPLWVG